MSLNHAHEGYEYQDLIASYFILKEVLLGNLDSKFSIDKKNIENDRFDDIVIKNSKEIQRKQIKYSNRDTGKKLTKDYLSVDSYYQIALHCLYETWKNLGAYNTEFRLCLAWDEPIDDNITGVLIEQSSDISSFATFPTKIFKIDLDKLWIECTDSNTSNFNGWNSLKNHVIKYKIDRQDFKKFCDELIIEVAFPKASLDFNRPDNLENILIEQAEKLGIGHYPNNDVYINDFLVRLAKLAGNYRTRSAEVSVTDVLIELRVKTDFGKIEQKFDVDANLNVTSDSDYSSFLTEIHNKKTILFGEPGSGKSWFLTNFINYLLQKNIPVVRHYCFTGTDDDLLLDRIKTDTFYGNLVSSILEEFPDLITEKRNRYVANLSELNILLSKIEDPFILIIDGLDHIERVLKNSKELSEDRTRIIEAISRLEAPENISIVLGSQNVEEIKFLTEDFNYQKILIPKWTINSTKQLMDKFSRKDINFGKDNLSELLYKKSEGNPLYLTYILRSIENIQQVSQEQIESLPQYDFNLQSYYKHLTAQLERNTTADTLSCLDFSLYKNELKEIVKPAYMMEKDLKILSPVIIENASRGGIRLYHDSFRRFNLERLNEEAIQELHENIAFWLEEKGFYENQKAYRYLAKYYIEACQYKKLRKLADVDFLVNSLYQGHSETLIKNNFKHFLSVAVKKLDWPFIIYLSELNRTIYSTISEEYHSQFIENFDLFFEAICVIEGTSKANNILYFNGDKNFNNHITVRAFYILQKYNYKPMWDDVCDLFEKRISFEYFQYFISSIINDEEHLFRVFRKIIKREKYNFLEIFILEIYKYKGFGKVLELYNSIIDINYKIAELINESLEVTCCINRLTIQGIAEKKLPTLNLDFIDNYRDFELVRLFQKTIKQYVIYDIEYLSSFEESIPPKNFIYNWMKFYICFLIAEKKLTGIELEQHIVDRIEFLTSDVNFFKDNPRPYDFISLNKNLISSSIAHCLKYLVSKDSWQKVISSLSKIRHYIPLILHIENNFLNNQNIPFLIEAYERFDSLEDVTYEEHAKYAFKKAIYYGKQGNKELAKEELKKALRYITGYTYRKDTSLNEVINPLSVLNKIDPNIALEYVKKLKYLTDAVMKHTEDGKGIKWITMDWFNKLIEIDYLLGTKYLIDQLILKPTFWKLDYMFVDYLHMSFDKVNPVILNFMYRLSPINNRDKYLSGFLNVLEKLKGIDANLVKRSLIDLSERHWNDSYDPLKEANVSRLISLLDEFELKHNFIESDINTKKNLLSTTDTVEKVTGLSSLEKDDELQKYIKEKRDLTDIEADYLCDFLKEKDNEGLIITFLLRIIQQQFLSDNLACKLQKIICDLPISTEGKIILLINNFVYAKNGWFANFTEQESLKIAVSYDRDMAMKTLAEVLYSYFSTVGYFSESTANLIIALTNVGTDKNIIIDMYKSGYQVLESRLPDINNFDWQDIDSPEFLGMDYDEFAIVMLLSKSIFHDSQVQREIICAISYFMRENEGILVKPFRWFFNHYEKFNQLFIATVLELLETEKDNNKKLLAEVKESLASLHEIENIYIHDKVANLIQGNS
ncbi:P-loop domain-containing protein [Pasteurella multocida]|uniref:ATP-binding protein n=1 Tax=Pasteurella multocida TaxID=747 RepID=UPI0018973D7E|nr:ATP-binding protein [Pasteurella multocida]MBF6984592.1 ATP-binding protein [Pasteurella multocida]MDA5609544.1 ATP-binding protein [Pasteurella multocida]MDA5612171.1 ATP-binding protein [Pasteurella multocida]